MAEINNSNGNNFTRREFMIGGSVAALTVALAPGVLVGCASERQETESEPSPEVLPDTLEAQVMCPGWKDGDIQARLAVEQLNPTIDLQESVSVTGRCS